MIIYKIKMLCYDPIPNSKPYEDEPADDRSYSSLSEAYDAAANMAEEEADGLNEGCPELISFGVVYDEYEGNLIRVNRYALESEHDNTGETDVVTEYSIVKVDALKVYGFTEVSTDGDIAGEKIGRESTSGVFLSKEEAEAAAWKRYCDEFKYCKQEGILDDPDERRIHKPDFRKDIWNDCALIQCVDFHIQFEAWTRDLVLSKEDC